MNLSTMTLNTARAYYSAGTDFLTAIDTVRYVFKISIVEAHRVVSSIDTPLGKWSGETDAKLQTVRTMAFQMWDGYVPYDTALAEITFVTGLAEKTVAEIVSETGLNWASSPEEYILNNHAKNESEHQTVMETACRFSLSMDEARKVLVQVAVENGLTW